MFFFVFFKEVSSAHQACIYLIQSTVKNNNILKYVLLFKIGLGDISNAHLVSTAGSLISAKSPSAVFK